MQPQAVLTGVNMRVKICGLSTHATMDTALDAGADMVGLVFFAKSPRNIDLDTAVPLAERARSRAGIVALVVDADDAALSSIVERVRPDILQLHGRETPERSADIRHRFKTRVWKAIGVETAADVARARTYYAATDMILFDAKPPRGSDIPGGNGVTFDWTLLADVKADRPYILAGGLTVDTVAGAIHATGTSAVDVSSAVESAPGIKDPARIEAFIRAAKSAAR